MQCDHAVQLCTCCVCVCTFTEQTQKLIPCISRETSSGQNVSELVFVSVKQPIKSNPVSSRHMSHCGTSSFDSIFDHSFFVFNNVQLRLSLRRMSVGVYVIHSTQLVNLLFSCDMLGLGFGIKNCTSFLVG